MNGDMQVLRHMSLTHAEIQSALERLLEEVSVDALHTNFWPWDALQAAQ